MPSRARSVPLVQVDGLRVAPVPVVVTAPMAEIDPADERDVLVHATGSADNHELLVMRAEPADPLVQQDLTTRVVHDLPELSVLLLAELALVGMGSPHQPAHVDPSPDSFGKHRPQFGPRSSQPLAGVPSPFEEPHLIPRTEAGQLLV